MSVEYKDFNVTVAQVLVGLRVLGDAYEAVVVGGEPRMIPAQEATIVLRAAEKFVLQVPYWTPVGESVPERNEMVLVKCGSGVSVGSYSPMLEDWWALMNPADGFEPTDSVTHWMRLPEAE